MAERPNSRRNLDIAIERLFDDQQEALRVRRMMANAIVGQMLPDGAVKGGSALKLRFGSKATRFSRDLDTARRLDIDEYTDALREALERGWNGFAGTLVELPPAKPEGVPSIYVMKPFEAKLSYNGKPWLTVPLEVGHNEIGDAEDPDLVVPIDMVDVFESLGFPAPGPIPLMKLSHQIAQKLHALTEDGSERVHDLIDLQIIVNDGNVDWLATKKACIRLFAYRGMQDWPPTAEPHAGWAEAYGIQAKGLDVAATMDEAIDWANGLIRHIDHA